MTFQVKESNTISYLGKKESVLVNLYGLKRTVNSVLRGAIAAAYLVCPEHPILHSNPPSSCLNLWVRRKLRPGHYLFYHVHIGLYQKR